MSHLKLLHTLNLTRNRKLKKNERMTDEMMLGLQFERYNLDIKKTGWYI